MLVSKACAAGVRGGVRFRGALSPVARTGNGASRPFTRHPFEGSLPQLDLGHGPVQE
jgi:hypothetical protein